MASVPMGKGDSQWAWLGDMELDDTLLGLGAAGIFPTPPLAVGFLVNAAHCAEQSSGDSAVTKASEMYREKRVFLDTFFRGLFFAVLDRYAKAGKSRGWVGDLTAEELARLGVAYGLTDELSEWIERVVDAQPSVLHLLLSGPLIGRGREVCQALRERLLDKTQIVFWTYAGSFNLTHSSEEDRQSLRDLFDSSPRVSMVETTLKSGSWLCDPSRPFWGQACPTAWTLEEAKTNAVGYDMSTDIQSVNMFLEEYSSTTDGAPKRGLRWIFQQIAEARGHEASELGVSALGARTTSVAQLLQELELRSLTTNLTAMVNPSSGSMGKVREALGAAEQAQLEAAHRKAVELLEALPGRGGGSSSAPGASVQEATRAAQAYAELYRGQHGDFHEAGCVECFPKDKPYSGPRLDKRCILRCMAQGQLQGGPTADLLVVLALLLHLRSIDPAVAAAAPSPARSAAGSAAEVEVPPVCCSLLCASNVLAGETSRMGQVPLCRSLPSETEALFRLQPGSATLPYALMTDLVPGTEMNEGAKRALAPLVDAAAIAAVFGARRLQATACSTAPWGLPRIGS